MAQGSAKTRTIKNSILKHIRHEYAFYPRIGRDYNVISENSLGENSGEGSYLISAIGHAERGGLDVPKGTSVGELALIRAINNLSMGGAGCESISVSIQSSSDCSEDILRSEMISLADIAKKLGIRIAGGNTTYSLGKYENGLNNDTDYSNKYSIEITAYGTVSKEILDQLSVVPKAGDKVAILGNAGSYGAAMITEKKRGEMTSRFSESYMDGIVCKNICMADTAKKLIDAGAIYIHDMTFGGIYRTLLETSEYSGLGIEVRHEDIPIKQSTIEVCEFWNLNPYKLLSTGGVVAVFREEDETRLIDKLSGLIKNGTNNDADESGIKIAGVLSESKERLILSERNKTHRSITLYEEDEIYKL